MKSQARKFSKLLKIGEVASLLNLSIDTLRRWDESGKLTSIKTPNGMRFYSVAQIKKLYPQLDMGLGSELPSMTQPLLDPSPKRSNYLKEQVSPQAWQATGDLLGAQAAHFARVEKAEKVINSGNKNFSPFFTAFRGQPGRVALALSGFFILLITITLATVWGSTFLKGSVKETKQVSQSSGADLVGKAVLADTIQRGVIHLNSDASIAGQLQVAGLIVNSPTDGFAISGGSSNRVLSVTGTDVLLNQELAIGSTPSFAALNLTAPTNQLLLPGGNQISLLAASGVVVLDTTTQTLTNKTIDGGSNTLTNIPSSALSDRRITINTSGSLTGGGEVELGDSIDLSASFSLGSATTGYLPLMSSSSQLGNSILSQSGTNLLVNGNLGATLTTISCVTTENGLVTGSGTCPTLGVSGTTNRLVKFTSSSAVGDSSITDSGSAVTIANPVSISGGGLTLVGSQYLDASAGTLGIGTNTQTGLTLGRNGAPTIINGSSITFDGALVAGNNDATFSARLGVGKEASFSAKIVIDSATPQINATQNRSLQLGFIETGAVQFLNANNYITATAGYINGSQICTLANGICIGSGSSHFQLNSGVLAANDVSESLAIGGVSTAAAKIYFDGVNGNTLLRGGAFVASSSGAAALIVNQSSTGDIFSASTSGLSRFVIAAGGNVGIGSSIPSQRLDVVGSGVFSGALVSATLDTGQGANELYDMDQNVLTTSNVTFNQLSLTSALSVANGGTGATTLTSNGILYGNGTGAIQVTTAGSNNQCLVGNTGGAPSWSSCSSAAGQLWQQSLGVVAPLNITDSLIIGRTATASGAITSGSMQVYGVNNLNPVASISAVSATAAFIIDNRVGDLFAASSSGLTRFVITQNGNVGIGTTVPGYGLDVAKKTTALNSNQDASLGSFVTASNPLPAVRYSGTAASANGYVYYIGGWNGSAYQTSVYYAKLNADGSVGDWIISGNSLPIGRGNASAVVHGGYIYIVGGYESNAVATIYYAKLNSDGSVGAWQTNPNNLPAARYDPGVVVANDYIYVTGGNNSGPQASVYYAKFNSDGTIAPFITSANSLPNSRFEHASVVANGYLYVLGGNSGIAQNTVFYSRIGSDGSIGAFTTSVNSLPASLYTHTAVVANGNIYVLGGTTGVRSAAVYYSRVNNNTGGHSAWQTNPTSLPVAINSSSTVVANGYIYNLGGDTGSAVATVYYASTARVLVAGNLDLLGLNALQLSSASGDIGGSIFAGNIFSAGNLEVTNSTSLWGSLSVSGPISGRGTLSLNTGSVNTPLASISGSTGLAGLIIDNSVGDLFSASSSGLSRFVIDQGGNVGIGTVTPGAKLQVAGNIYPTVDDSYNLGSDTLRWQDVFLGPGTAHIGTSTSDEYTLGYDTSANRLEFNVNGSGNAEVVFDSSGNVGIGSISPGAKLDVTGGAIISSGLTLSAGNISLTGSQTINSTGTLGIGTSSSTSLTLGRSGAPTVIDGSSITINGALINGGGSATISGTLGVGGEASLSAKLILDSANPEINATQNRTLQLGYQTTGAVSFLNANNYITATAAYINNSQVCTASGNCAGSGGMVSGTGTQNYITKWNNGGGTGIGNSLLYDNGSGVALGTTTPVGLLSVSGKFTGKANTILNETGDQAVFTASVSGATKFIIANDGNVGIGTSVPAKLFSVGSGSLFTVDSAGNVGFNSSSSVQSITAARTGGTALNIAFTDGGASTTDGFTVGSGSDSDTQFRVSSRAITLGSLAQNVYRIYSGSTYNLINFSSQYYGSFAGGVNGGFVRLYSNDAGNGALKSSNFYSAYGDGGGHHSFGFHQSIGVEDIVLALRRADNNFVTYYDRVASGNALTASLESAIVDQANAEAWTLRSINTMSTAGTNLLSVYNNTTRKFYINKDGGGYFAGSTALGTTSPLATLDIRSQSGILPTASLSGATAFAGLVVDNSGTGDLFTASSSGLNRFVITQNGNVGIGTSVPTAKLVIAGNTNWTTGNLGIFNGGTDGGYINHDNESLILASNINPAGSVLNSGRATAKILINSGISSGSINLYTTNTNNSAPTLHAALNGSGDLTLYSGAADSGDTSFRLSNHTSIIKTGLIAEPIGSFGRGNLYFALNNTADSSTVAKTDARLTILNTGNVGVGTTTPVGLFNVSGKTTGKALTTLNETGDQAVFTASISGAPKFTIANDGNVGIGTIIPAKALHVANDDFQLVLQNTAAGGTSWYIGGTSNGFAAGAGKFVINNADSSGDADLTIDANGNVGINSTSPGFKLQVNDSQSATAAAMIFNTNTGTDSDGLIIKLGSTTTVNNNNHFIEFMNNVGVIKGVIRGNSNAVQYQTSGVADFGEYMPVDSSIRAQGDWRDSVMNPGRVVCFGDTGVKPCEVSSAAKMVGVISDTTAFIGGYDLPENSIVGFLGQIYTQVASDSSAISVGDALGISANGQVKKATDRGYIIGRAVESWSPGQSATVLAYVNPGYYEGVGLDLATKKSVDEIQHQVELLAEGIGASNSGNIDIATMSANFGTFYDNLQSIGTTQLGNTSIGGTLDVGLLHIDDVAAEISSLTGTVTVRGILRADVVETEQIKVLGAKSAGSGTIVAGQTSVSISAESATPSARVLVTPTTLTDRALVVSSKSVGEFVVSIKTADTDDIDFDWLVIQN